MTASFRHRVPRRPIRRRWSLCSSLRGPPTLCTTRCTLPRRPQRDPAFSQHHHRQRTRTPRFSSLCLLSSSHNAQSIKSRRQHHWPSLGLRLRPPRPLRPRCVGSPSPTRSFRRQRTRRLYRSSRTSSLRRPCTPRFSICLRPIERNTQGSSASSVSSFTFISISFSHLSPKIFSSCRRPSHRHALQRLVPTSRRCYLAVVALD